MRAVRVLCLAVAWLGVALGGESPVDPVPRLQEDWLQLSSDEQTDYRKLFEKLDDDDFDVREGALQRLVARGPAILSLAEEYAGRQEQSVAGAASELRLRIFTRYDGWWPVAAPLRAQLERRVEGGWPHLDASALARPLAPLEDFAARQGIRLVIDPRALLGAQAFFQQHEEIETPTAFEILRGLAQSARMDVLPRGNVLLVSSSETIERLSRQRRVLDWKTLALTGDEARRLTEGLEAFFPAISTELHGSADALSVRGVVGCSERALRLVALMARDAPAAVWPPPDPGLSFTSVVTELSKPVDTLLNNSEPLIALQSWRKQGVVVGLWCDGKVYDEAPYPLMARGMAPLTLKLKGIPLGLTLRWYADRAKFAAAQQVHLAVFPEVGDAGQVRMRIGEKRRNVLDLSVAGCDVSALSWGEEVGEPADKAIEGRLRDRLRAHLELFPGLDPDRDLRVRRGRLLMQGTPSALAYALDLVRQWTVDRRPPICAWYDRIDRSLDKEVNWDGRGLSAGSLLRKLRVMGEFPILLVDSPQGEPPYFKLTGEQAELLEPGMHSLRALLDELAVRASAKWEIRWGAVVLYAAPPQRKRASDVPVPQPEKPAPKEDSVKSPASPGKT